MRKILTHDLKSTKGHEDRKYQLTISKPLHKDKSYQMEINF